jgi:hypothetical protein
MDVLRRLSQELQLIQDINMHITLGIVLVREWPEENDGGPRWANGIPALASIAASIGICAKRRSRLVSSFGRLLMTK